MARILVVDDEPTLVRTLKFSLEREGYDVLTASDGEQALAAAREGTPDLILLDIMLQGLDGYEVCRVLRRETSVPIIMLTARTGEADKVVGLELGADDYVTKPFSMKELVARVRARLRRPETEASGQLLSAGSLKVDLTRREVTRDDKIIPLKPKEFELLGFMMRNRGRVLSRNQLLQSVWHYDGFDQTRTVDVHIGRLRDKLESDQDSTVWILTVRGAGYRFSG